MSEKKAPCSDTGADPVEGDDCPLPIAQVSAREAPNDLQEGTRAQRILVARAKSHVAARVGERTPLGAISKALGVSAPYLTSTFRQVTGIPLYRYVLRKRLERAVTLLPHYKADLSQLALEIGFSSHAHFSATFSRVFGCTPAFVRTRARIVCRTLRSLRS